MQNKYAVSIVIGILCLAWTESAAAEPVFANKIDSGLEVGAEVAAWEPVHLTGPYSGTKTCPVCTHLKQPVILAFAKWGKDTGAMMLYFERIAAKYPEHHLNVYLVLIDGDPSEVKRLAKKHGIEKVSVCQLDGQTRQHDLELYKISPAVDNTVMMYRNFRVCSSMANVTAEDLKVFDDDVFQALQHPDAAATQETAQRTGGRVANGSRSAEEKIPQIVGTWEWALDVGPEGQKAKMVVREKAGKLSALVTAPDGKEVMSEDFAVKEGRVTFTIRPEMGIMKMVMSHDGVLKGDEIIGTANMKGGFMRKGSKWHARRVPEG